jgi:hypothetical protein
MTANLLLFAACRSVFHPGPVTIRLKPQMKKYRSLWYKSTTNHNILYFLSIPGIRSLNTAICLWKAENTPMNRGLQGPDFADFKSSRIVSVPS